VDPFVDEVGRDEDADKTMVLVVSTQLRAASAVAKVKTGQTTI
jgi:hypothetical protein